MATLPADRTKLALAQSNQNPSNVLGSSQNKNALTEAYDTLDLLYSNMNGLISAAQLSKLGIINVKDYNASGSAQTTTGNITAGSNVLTLATTLDFANGQGINVNGKTEVDNLQITAAATVSSNVTVTLNGVAFTVAVLAGDTITQVSTKIRSAVYAGWTISGATDTIIFTSTTTGTRTTPVYSAGTTTATGTMTVTTLGSADFITTISSGAGTSTLTLAANATTTSTGQTVSHDDTQAFINAIANCPSGGVLYVPRGTYLITQELDITKNMTIKGTNIQDDTQNSVPLTGSVLNFKSTVVINAAIQTTSDGVHIEDIFVNNTSVTVSNIPVGIRILPFIGGVAWNITLRNVYVKGFGTHGIYAQGLLVSTFDHVFSSNNQNGFYFDNTTLNGTSLILNNCWALKNSGYGYYFKTYYYTSLNACAADTNNIAYFFTTCKAISMNGCGTENSIKQAIYLIDSTEFTAISCFGYNSNTSNTADSGVSFFLASPTCKNVTLIGCNDNTPKYGTYSVSIGSGVITCLNCTFPYPVVSNGVSKTYNADSFYTTNAPFQAPMPTTTTGVLGTWSVINVASGGGYTLPSGGTWLYFIVQYNNGSYSTTITNTAAGGTVILNATTGISLSGFAWRIG